MNEDVTKGTERINLSLAILIMHDVIIQQMRLPGAFQVDLYIRRHASLPTLAVGLVWGVVAFCKLDLR